MEHVVFFPAHDASPAFRRVGSLEDAVRLVEHLRNVEGVSEVSVHALTEVPLAFKAWYRVEVPAGDEASAPAAEESALPDAAAVQPEPAGETPVVNDAGVEPVPEPPTATAPQPEPAAVAEAAPAEPIGLAPEPAAPPEPALAGPDGARSLGFFS